MSKQKSRRRRAPRPSSAYQRNIRQADEALLKEGVEIRPDNWQQLALDWFALEGPERGLLARYIAEHEPRLGVPWARDLLRLQIFFQAEDYQQVVAHYERAFACYPRCAVVEMWVADYVYRHLGDFWQAREMYHYAIAQLPDHPKPYYELGFMSYLLGDFAGALRYLDQAVDRLPADDVELGARAFYNRGLIRYSLEGDKQAAIADVQEALRRKPDYPQAKEALRGLRGKMRWVPW